MNTQSLLFCAVILLTPVFSPVFAATSGFIDIFVDDAAENCNDSVLVVESTWSFTTDDAGGKDLVGIIVYDGSGSALATDWQGSVADRNFLRLTAFGGQYGKIEIHSRPITIDLYDLSRIPGDGHNTNAARDSILSQSPPLLERLIYDPAEDIASCESIPLAINLQAEDEVLRVRRLALGIPMMLLILLLPIRQVQRNRNKKFQS